MHEKQYGGRGQGQRCGFYKDNEQGGVGVEEKARNESTEARQWDL